MAWVHGSALALNVRQIVYWTDKYNKLTNFVEIWAIGVKSLKILIIDVAEILCSIDKYN